MLSAIQAQQQTQFANDVDMPADLANGVQRIFIGVLGALHPWGPLFTTVSGMQDQVVCANRPAFLLVLEIDVQERFGWAFLLQGLRIFLGALQRFAFARLGGVVLDRQVANLSPIQLAFPALTAIGAVQDHAIVTYRPALGLAGEINSDQVAAERERALREMLAGVLGMQDMTAGAHRYDSLQAVAAESIQRRAGCELRQHGRLSQGVGKGEHGGYATPGSRAQCQHLQHCIHHLLHSW
ncbi:hypothetical protein D3C85_1078480 [compost metagenome]